MLIGLRFRLNEKAFENDVHPKKDTEYLRPPTGLVNIATTPVLLIVGSYLIKYSELYPFGIA